MVINLVKPMLRNDLMVKKTIGLMEAVPNEVGVIRN